MKLSLALILVMLSFSHAALASGGKVAVVKLLRGEVEAVTGGKTKKLKLEDWVVDGSVVKTAEKSFVKLVFIDKSQMNVGPSSEMRIEKFSGKDSGVIDLVKGKIRSQVTKDYLQMGQDKSKLFIKTQNAVMGVRGTDFMISTNGKNTSTVLFEGAVVFNRLDNRGEVDSRNLEDIVSRGVTMFPGEFSVVDGRGSQPTLPSLLNIHQRERLEKAENFEGDRGPGNSEKAEVKKSIVPTGLTGTAVGNDTGVLKKEIAREVPRASSASKRGGRRSGSENPNSFTRNGRFKPTNGSFLHVDTGIIVAPPPESVYDPNTNTYIPVNSGSVASNGNYIPPSNMEITPDGKVLVSATNEAGQTVVQEVVTNSPVLTTSAVVATAANDSSATGSKGGGMKDVGTTGDFSTFRNDTTTVTGGAPTPGTSGQISGSATTRTTINVN